MRRHVKASTAGSTQRQAKGLGRIFRAAAATRGASPQAKGSGAPSTGRIAFPVGVFIAILAAMALIVATAGATKTHSFKEVFGSAAQPSFGSDNGIAIEQSTGDVLVMDASNSTIKRYNADGSADNFSALGSNVIDGAGTGDETPQGGLGFASSSESQIAVDNSGGATDGNIYVTQSSPNAINVFAKTGAYLGQLSAAGATEFSEACGVAVDPSGALYVGDYSSGIHRFAPAANPPVNADHTATFTTVSNPCTLAAGAGASAGFLFAAQYLGPISKLDSGTGEVKYEVSADSHTTLTVDPGTGNVYGATGSSVKEFDASGAVSATGVSAIAAGGSVEGVAVRAASGDVYLSRSGTSNIEVFNGAVATIPDVTIAPATNNTGTKATLNGTVNPDGVELSQCKFEYGKTTAYGSTVPCAESPATIGAGTSPVSVHADISGLAPNETTYNFRLLATNPQASANSSNQSFTTPETVITEAASAISPEAATLNGSVNPDGVAITECLFEWGTTTSYGETAPCVPNAAGIGSGTSPVSVSAALSGLNPGTVYHFRLKAANADGPILGKDLSFATLGPLIAATWSEDVTFTEATLKAEINPKGAATTYRFEYGTSEAYGQQTPELAVGSDSANHVVSRFLAGLAPGTTYHYRVVATNADAENLGPDTTFTTYERLAPETDCPNQAFRFGVGANLPDCRAYEMVSPIDKNGGNTITAEARLGSKTMASFHQSSASGDKLTFSATAPFAGALANRFSNQYLSTRGSDGWSTEAINAPRTEPGSVFDPLLNDNYNLDTVFRGFTDDLSSAWVLDDATTPLAPEAAEGFGNLYRRDNTNGSYEALTITTPTHVGVDPLGWQTEFAGYSADLNHMLFEAGAALTPDAAPNGSRQLYDFTNGELKLVSVLPGGAADPGDSYAGLPGAPHRKWPETAISSDGSRIFWTSGLENGGELFVRINGTETHGISEQVAINPVSEAAAFWRATPDGSEVLFSVRGTDGGQKSDKLYVYNVDSETPTLVAEKVTGVLGASADLSYIYFASKAILAVGAVEGVSNLYLSHEGTIRHIATLGDDSGGGLPLPAAAQGLDLAADRHRSRVTPDGRAIAFMSNRSLTGYDNVSANNGVAAFEVFVYHAGPDRLTCASCNPSEARPITRKLPSPFTTVSNYTDPEEAAAWIPGWEWGLQAPKALTDDGRRLIFHSFDPLVPDDANGAQDVYQWEEGGSGSCQAPGGCISLLSTGESPDHSTFIDASDDGDEVFFRTASGIDPRDPGLVDIYAAKVNGGFALPSAAASCEGDACQTPQEPPNDPTPASSTFEGSGNVKEHRCPKGKRKVRRAGKVRCVPRRCPNGKRRVLRAGSVRCVSRRKRGTSEKRHRHSRSVSVSGEETRR